MSQTGKSKHALHTQTFMRSSETGSVMGAYLWCDCGWPGNWVGDVPGMEFVTGAVGANLELVKTVMAGNGMPLTMEVSRTFAVHIKEWAAANPCTCPTLTFPDGLPVLHLTDLRPFKVRDDKCPQHGGEQSQPSRLDDPVQFRER